MNATIKAAWHDNTVRMDDSSTVLLVQSYRWHRQHYANGTTRGVHAGMSAIALELARVDVAAGNRRYPSLKPYPAVSWKADNRPRSRERIGYVQSVDGAGLRLVGEVVADTQRGDIWNNRSDKGGWYTDPYGDVFRDGTGLCWGVVYQLPARDGKARFVAGYEFGGVEGGPTIDFGTVYESDWSGDYYNNNARELDAARDAARAADGLAQSAAESERAYQAAWQAGSAWAQLGDDIAETRKALLAMLAERRLARMAGANYPALCVALAGKVSAMLADIGAWRSKRDDYAAGDDDSLGFYTGDAELRAAFNDGAGRVVLE